jgi:hypothetical protein
MLCSSPLGNIENSRFVILQESDDASPSLNLANPMYVNENLKLFHSTPFKL